MNEVRAQQEDLAHSDRIIGMGHAAHVDQRVQRALQILDIGGRMLVQDHEIDRQMLRPPILHRLQEITRDIEVFHLADA